MKVMRNTLVKLIRLWKKKTKNKMLDSDRVVEFSSETIKYSCIVPLSNVSSIDDVIKYVINQYEKDLNREDFIHNTWPKETLETPMTPSLVAERIRLRKKELIKKKDSFHIHDITFVDFINQGSRITYICDHC